MKDKKRKAWLYSVDKDLAKQLKSEDISEILGKTDIDVNLLMCMNPLEPQDKLYRYYFEVTYRNYKDLETFEDCEILKIASAEAVILDPWTCAMLIQELY